MAKSAEQRAAERGARWLDRYHGHWAANIDIRTLDLEDGSMCVLGQCFGDYYDTLNQFRPNDVDRDEPWARTHGFNCQLTADGKNDKPGSYERLGLAWAPLVAVRQIKARSARRG